MWKWCHISATLLFRNLDAYLVYNSLDPKTFCINHMIAPNLLEESLSITTGRCDLAIATHARKMHKKIPFDLLNNREYSYLQMYMDLLCHSS